MLSSQLRLRHTGGYNTRGATVYSKNGKKLSSMDLESISCAFCQLVLKHPVQLISCGDRFCRPCIESISSCPIDGQLIDPQQIRDDKGCQKELLSLESSCTMVMKGCTWRGPLIEIEDHLLICAFATEKCHDCSQYIPKHKMDIHKSEECPNMEIKCAYQGCDAVMLLSQSSNHYLQHLHQMAVVLCNTVAMVEKLTAENALLRQNQEKMHKELLSFTFHGRGFQSKKPLSSPHRVESDGPEYELPETKHDSFKTPGGSVLSYQTYEPSLASTLSSGYGSLPASTAASSVPPTTSDDSVCQIQTRLDYIEPLLEELKEEVRKQGSQIVGCVESVAAVQETVTRHAIAMEEVKLRQDVLDVKTTTGLFIWKIPNVKKRYKDAIDRRTMSLYSPPFYTSPHGYRMCLRAYLNGDGSGKATHISVFLVLMRSEHDNLLRWPFVQPVTFTLLNQIFPSKSISETFLPDSHSPSFQQPQSEMNIASGFPRLASQSVLHDDNFTKGNAIFIRCRIDTQGLTAY